MPPVILTLNPLCYEGVYITYSQAAVMDSVYSLHLKRCKECLPQKKKKERKNSWEVDIYWGTRTDGNLEPKR